MNAIEIKGLKKSFRGMYALNGLNMTVPVGSSLFSVDIGVGSYFILKKSSLI